MSCVCIYINFFLYTFNSLNKSFDPGSKGQAQMIIPLKPNAHYYVTIRVITGAGNPLDSSSDGVVIDITSPSVKVITFGEPVELQASGAVFQRDQKSVPGAWEVEDQESGVKTIGVIIGTCPGMLRRIHYCSLGMTYMHFVMLCIKLCMFSNQSFC